MIKWANCTCVCECDGDHVKINHSVFVFQYRVDKQQLHDWFFCVSTCSVSATYSASYFKPKLISILLYDFPFDDCSGKAGSHSITYIFRKLGNIMGKRYLESGQKEESKKTKF